MSLLYYLESFVEGLPWIVGHHLQSSLLKRIIRDPSWTRRSAATLARRLFGRPTECSFDNVGVSGAGAHI